MGSETMRNPLSNSNGQVIIENVLLMTILIGGIIFLSNSLRESETVAKLVSGPWTKISGMLECGVWEAPSKACSQHPNQTNRGVSLRPQ